MNHLAHLLLAGPDPALRAGGFLGDFVRGPLKGERPAPLELGIRLHRHIDATTDRHPAVRQLVARFEPPWRRWAPVALDVWFDHLLARRFTEFADEPLPVFTAAACDDLEHHLAWFPAPAATFLLRMREAGLLEGYRRRDTIDAVLARLARRSPRAAPLANIHGELDRLEPELEAGFDALMPGLIDHCANWRRNRLPRVD